jgi:hypothetical protein
MTHQERKAETQRLMAALRGDGEPVMLTEIGELVGPDARGSQGLELLSDALFHEFLESQPEWVRLITPASSGQIRDTEMPLQVVVAYLAWAYEGDHVTTIEQPVLSLSRRIGITVEMFLDLMVKVNRYSTAERARLVDEMLQQRRNSN